MRKLKNSELKRLSGEEFKKAKKKPICVVLDNIRSANNVGSVFRTSDAFLIEKIFLCGFTSCPPNPEIHKTALGATDTVEWEKYEHTIELIRKLKSEGYTIISVEQTENSVMADDFVPEKNVNYALVFGNEVNGVDQDIVDLSDFCLEIPQFGTKHSLNISVCAGIVLWDFTRKMQAQYPDNK
ncbi:MAG: RNA methyltransferase [Bacteroidetes bacterium GWF2_38_335]|nr:MAG: RNA methyltransferase [Bacteroidetes bacterium GWF2_38_335]OFY78065.1 MAG: RNA methyltransferase [Bacteroidetes bacterium RIFOXYA12_FULL_38_20]HBS88337.1 RNA methyltransferase [Bacteroidales bacterium]